MLNYIAVGFSEIASPVTILLIAGGVLLGCLRLHPRLSATMAIALCLPMTYGMLPINGMALLIGLYIGGISGRPCGSHSPPDSGHPVLRGHLL